MDEGLLLYRLLCRERFRARRGLIPRSLRTPPQQAGTWLGRQSTILAWKIGEWWAKPRCPSSIGILNVNWTDLYWIPDRPSNGTMGSRTQRY